MPTFDVCINRLLGNEGGYVNDPDDPGGETNWGISKRSYPNIDIKNLTREQAIEIYRSDFWERAKMDQLPAALAFQVLDFAVNSGIETAVRKLQAAAGVADDGHIGPVTMAAIQQRGEAVMIMCFVAERLDFWRRLARWPKFGNGWAGRAAADLRYAAQDIPGASGFQ